MIRSPDYFYQNFHPYADYAGWASATKLAEPFQRNNADQLFKASCFEPKGCYAVQNLLLQFCRVGERLRLVAINRATGYMGTTTFTGSDPRRNKQHQ